MTLSEVINEAKKQILILPSFQRGFKWRAENIRKLLESLVLNYPIGGVLLWQTSNAIFEWRSLESVELRDENEDESQYNHMTTESNVNSRTRFKYILDGQQRLTSIYKIFPPSFNKTEYEIQNLNNTETYRFFIDLNKLNFPIITKENYENYRTKFPTDIDAIADSCIVKNFLKIRREFNIRYNTTPMPNNLPDSELLNLLKEQKLFPLTSSFLTGDITILNNWIAETIFGLTNDLGGGFSTNQKLNEIYQAWLTSFMQNIQTILVQKTIPVIQVPENTSWEGLARIFETINSTGLSLSTFDLLVAKLSFWEEENNIKQNLRNIVNAKLSEENFKIFDDKKNLGGIACQQLPRVFALSAAIYENKEAETSLKKSEILGLETQLLINVSHISCERMNNGLDILKKELGVKNKNFLPFKDAITLSSFVQPAEINRYKAYYWYVLFTEKDLDKDSNSTTKRLYEEWNLFKSESSEHLISKVKEKLGETFPSFDEVLDIANTTSLLYRAFLTYVYSKSTKDWASENVQSIDGNLEDHHIFPTRWLTTNIQDISQNLRNNILNRLLVSKLANGPKYASNNAPALYLKNFANMNDFLLPESFRHNHPINMETLKNKYQDRYNLIKLSILSDIESFIKN